MIMAHDLASYFAKSSGRRSIIICIMEVIISMRFSIISCWVSIAANTDHTALWFVSVVVAL